MASSSGLRPEKYVLKDGHQLKEIFIGPDKYYEFADSNMAPCYRFFSAMEYYNELTMRCDKDYLKAFCNAILDTYKVKPGEAIDIGKIPQLALQTLERLELIMEPESVYKYASVVIFDESEDPYAYDFKYNKEVKIPRWKALGIPGFFLSTPVKKLFPHLDLSAKDLEAYLKIVTEIGRVHLENIFTMLSSAHSTKGWYKSLELLRQKEQLSPT